MDLCWSGHDTICYEGKRCPCCEALERIVELEAIQKEMQKELDEL